MPRNLLISRIFTAIWGIIFIGGAMLFTDINNPVVELGLGIASFTYGGLLGVFLMGVISKKVQENSAIIAQWSSIYFMTWIIGITGFAQYVIISLNIIAFLWIFMNTHDRKPQLTLLLLLVGISSLIRFVEPIHFGWPWYVFIGCAVTFLVGLFLTLLQRNQK